ncbi:poly-gamma-glutamate hydrolase family protein [Oceanobacillus polygoni]|uniref:Phage replication-related protein YjqB (UPF0714/DUF867 family) n=1 Tax=Oceanobacillus polygoni TaxID=1235259 RepID=A0A9X0Z2I5_9BACI|nr:poly-gamma-glutamate hydrolase family protein [Oceanobacillus polygoni]MBP2080120.1 phage replication-related protein YjqB (UPF0714/DUF867 family) [Oceanobacillus polygoni]
MNKFNKLYYTLFLSAFLLGCSLNEKYLSYKDLKEHELLNEDYEINYQSRGSDIVVIAIHGGDIEPGTSEVVKGLANQMALSYYLFEGIKPTNNMILHIDSKYFDEPIGRNIVQNSVSTLSIHGYEGQGNESIIYLGGRNKEYKETIRYSLQNRGFQVEDAPPGIAGMSEKNIVNDNQLKKGVQLELTAELRRSLFKNDNRSYQDTTNVYDKLIDSLEEATNHYLKTS